MPTSWGSDVVNGQLVPRTPSSAVFPLVFSAQYSGPGYWPKQGTFQVPPVLPQAVSNQAAPGAYGNAAMGTPIVPSTVSQTGNPWHPTKSPLLFGFLFLVIALLMLHYVHW